MGVSVWIRLKQPIGDVDPLQTDGKLLAKAMDILDRASRELHVRPLSDFYSVSKKAAMAEVEGAELSEEEWDAIEDDHVWWPPAEGLASVQALLKWVSENPKKVHRPDDVTADLVGFRSVLEAAVRENTEFNVAVDW